MGQTNWINYGFVAIHKQTKEQKYFRIIQQGDPDIDKYVVSVGAVPDPLHLVDLETNKVMSDYLFTKTWDSGIILLESNALEAIKNNKEDKS